MLLKKILKISKNTSKSDFKVEFYSDFSQLKYVFAEVVSIREIKSLSDNETSNSNPIDAKIRILEDEVEIIEVQYI